MVNRSDARRWRSSLCLAASLLLAVGPAGAGTLSIENALVDFQFNGANVDYNPDPDKIFLTSDNARVTFATKDNVAAPGTYRSGDGLQSALFLDATHFGDLMRIPFNTFGSLSTVEGASPTDLIQDSAQAMGGKNLQFIVDAAPVSGSLASRFRDARIYATVAGLSAEDWLRPYGDSRVVRVDFLTAANEVAGGALAPAVPVPPTFFLFLAAGLPLYLTRRRRRR